MSAPLSAQVEGQTNEGLSGKHLTALDWLISQRFLTPETDNVQFSLVVELRTILAAPAKRQPSQKDEEIVNALTASYFKDSRGWPIDEVTLTKIEFQAIILAAITKRQQPSQTDEEKIAMETAERRISELEDLGYLDFDGGEQEDRTSVVVNTANHILSAFAALRAKSEKPQSSGKKEAPADDVKNVLQKFNRIEIDFPGQVYGDKPRLVFRKVDGTISSCREATAVEYFRWQQLHVVEVELAAVKASLNALQLLAETRRQQLLSSHSNVTGAPPLSPIPSESEKDTERLWTPNQFYVVPRGDDKRHGWFIGDMLPDLDNEGVGNGLTYQWCEAICKARNAAMESEKEKKDL